MTCEEKLSAAQTALIEGDVSQAESLYQELLDDDPENLRALDGMGVLHCRLNNTAEAIDLFRKALFLAEEIARNASNPPDALRCRATLLLHLGLALKSRGQNDEAVDVFQCALEWSPDDADAVLNLGQLHFEANRYDEAVSCFQKLSELQPDNASAWLTLGYIASLREQYAEAIEALHRAERLDSASPEICFYLAEAYRKTERYEESLPFYQRMLQVARQWPQAVHGYGKSLLALGKLEDGWDAMEFRLACTFGTWERHYLPNWEGSADEDKTVLAYSEEGIAAQIMLASCLPDLIDTVGHCVVECEASLHGLFRRSFPRAQIVPLSREDVGNYDPQYPERSREHNPWGLALDEQVAFGSLPRFFRRRHEDFPLRKAYLVPDRQRVARWSDRLAEIGPTAKIGVLWQGGWTVETPRQTSLPLPELRNMMLRHQGDAAWICLQHGSKQKEIEQYRRNVSLHIHLFPEAFAYDLDEMAALVTSLDLLITPPGYVAHLGGALGVRTWTILPAGADWRWNLGRPDSLWHPGMRVYRRQSRQSWSDLFDELELDLQTFLARHRPPEEETPPILSMPSLHKTAGYRRRAAA